MSEAERHGMAAALALLEHGFQDYALCILERLCGRPGRAPIGMVEAGATTRAIAAIREALSDAD